MSLRSARVKGLLTESVLEDEGMRVFEWWGGEYHPLEDLIAEMDEEEVIRILKAKTSRSSKNTKIIPTLSPVRGI